MGLFSGLLNLFGKKEKPEIKTDAEEKENLTTSCVRIKPKLNIDHAEYLRQVRKKIRTGHKESREDIYRKFIEDGGDEKIIQNLRSSHERTEVNIRPQAIQAKVLKKQMERQGK